MPADGGHADTLAYMNAEERRLEQLRAEATHARQRADLYRARTLTGRSAEPARLRELERISAGAAARLAHAEREHRAKE